MQTIVLSGEAYDNLGGDEGVVIVVLCRVCGEELLTIAATFEMKLHYNHQLPLPTLVIEPCKECIRRAVRDAETRQI